MARNKQRSLPWAKLDHLRQMVRAKPLADGAKQQARVLTPQCTVSAKVHHLASRKSLPEHKFCAHLPCLPSSSCSHKCYSGNCCRLIQCISLMTPLPITACVVEACVLWGFPTRDDGGPEAKIPRRRGLAPAP